MRENWDGSFEPRLATEWKIDTSAPSITFSLRKGVKFHDGSDFNAEAVRWNLQALIDAKIGNSRYWKSLEIIDDYTIRVNLTNWLNTMLGTFASIGVAFVSPSAYKTNGVQWMRENMVGTGPFKLTKFERDVRARFVKNENYWEKDKPYLDGVDVLYVKEKFTQTAAIQSGAADVLMLDLGKEAADLQRLGFNIVSRSSGIVCLIPDSANAQSPFSDKRVREAVEYAIDKEALIAAKGYGFLKPAYQVAIPGTMAYDPALVSRKYNLEKAKQLLADAGYAAGFKYKIVVTTTGMDRDIMVDIQSQLGKAGIKIELDFPEYAKYLEYRQGGPWSGAILAQPTAVGANYNGNLTQYWAAPSTLFRSLQRPAELQPLADASVNSVTLDANKIKAIVKLLYDDAMVIPLYDAKSGAAVQDYLRDGGFLMLSNHFTYKPDTSWLSK